MQAYLPGSVLCVCLLMGCASRQAEAPSAARNETIKGLNRGDFVGAWRLVSWTSTAGGRTNFPFDADAKGLLVYTADGQMSVFLSRSNRSAFARPESNAGTADEKVAAFDSCFAYAGTFPVVEGRVMHRLEHCTFPNWIGTEQVRFVRFEGDRLILETPPLPSGSGNAVSRLVWERARP